MIMRGRKKERARAEKTERRRMADEGYADVIRMAYEWKGKREVQREVRRLKMLKLETSAVGRFANRLSQLKQLAVALALFCFLPLPQGEGWACPELVEGVRVFFGEATESTLSPTLCPLTLPPQLSQQEYIGNGTRLGWLIDPTERHVYTYRPGLPIEQLNDPSPLNGTPILPGSVFLLNVLNFS
jgi:hypothetical protein